MKTNRLNFESIKIDDGLNKSSLFLDCKLDQNQSECYTIKKEKINALATFNSEPF